MKKRAITISGVVLFLLYISSCNSNTTSGNKVISSDSATIAKGKITFTQYCSGCHNFRQSGIGPPLGGITDSVPANWIRHFINDPQILIESGDERAQQLFKKYKTAMPSFSKLTDDEMNGIIAFLHTHKKPVLHISKDFGKELSNPIADSIKLSNLVVDLQLVTQVPASSKNGKLPLARITKLDFDPYTGSSFILDLRGKLYKLENNKPSVYLDLAKLKPKLVDQPGLGTGFGSFAFHPGFAKNGLLYTAHSEVPGSGKADFVYADSIEVGLQYVLTEWKADNPGAATFSGTSRELLRINMPYIIHGIQEITFNPLAKQGNKDYGMLYLGIGDGGCVEIGYPFLTHSLEEIWGTILRIDPGGSNSANGHYGIPSDNPFAKNKNTKTLGEIYAWGFKNPHRITWTKAGQMLVSNIGESNIESVNLVMPGQDYGWPTREGSFVLDPYGDLTKVYPLPPNDSIYNITYPVAQYDHDGGWTAIAGGFEYWGTSIPQLKGKFLFGDVASGRLFYIETAGIKQGKQSIIKEWKISKDAVQTTFKELTGNDNRVDMHFGRDARGELYLFTKPDGKVYKLVSATLKPSTVH